MKKPRLYQAQFDEKFEPTVGKDVTPEGFTGFEADDEAPKLGRLVREVEDSVYIKSPQDVGEYFLTNVFVPFEDFDQEELWVLLVNTKNRVTHEVMVYRGTIDTTYVRNAELLKDAVRVNARAFIIAHNHPSGEPEPSPEDIQMTNSAHRAAKLLDVELLDHVIIGKGRWVSLKEQGYMNDG